MTFHEATHRPNVVKTRKDSSYTSPETRREPLACESGPLQIRVAQLLLRLLKVRLPKWRGTLVVTVPNDSPDPAPPNLNPLAQTETPMHYVPCVLYVMLLYGCHSGKAT